MWFQLNCQFKFSPFFDRERVRKHKNANKLNTFFFMISQQSQPPARGRRGPSWRRDLPALANCFYSSSNDPPTDRWTCEWRRWCRPVWRGWEVVKESSSKRTHLTLRECVLSALNFFSVDTRWLLVFSFSSSSTTGRNSRATNIDVSIALYFTRKYTQK